MSRNHNIKASFDCLWTQLVRVLPSHSYNIHLIKVRHIQSTYIIYVMVVAIQPALINTLSRSRPPNRTVVVKQRDRETRKIKIIDHRLICSSLYVQSNYIPQFPWLAIDLPVPISSLSSPIVIRFELWFNDAVVVPITHNSCYNCFYFVCQLLLDALIRLTGHLLLCTVSITLLYSRFNCMEQTPAR